MSTDLTRRTVMLGALVIAGGGATWWFREQRRLERVLAEILELARETDLVAGGTGLGRSYLSAHPGEADPKTLLGLLFPDGVDSDSLGSRLAERIGRDWIELETVQLDGWILARSEGRLLALVALLSPDSP